MINRYVARLTCCMICSPGSLPLANHGGQPGLATDTILALVPISLYSSRELSKNEVDI